MVKNQFKENAMSETRKRAKYTLEFKMEAVRLVKGGQAVSVTAKVLGIPKASLDNWVKLSAKGQLKGAGDKPVSAEQMELARLRAQLARVTVFQSEAGLPPIAVAAHVQHHLAVTCVCQIFVDKCDCNICHMPHSSCLVAVYCLKAIWATYFCCGAQCAARCGLCGCAAASTAVCLGGV